MEKSLEPGPYPIGRSAPRRRRFGNWVVVAALLLVVAIIGAVGLAPRLWSATFGFLHQKTGWDISFSFLPYSAGDPYWCCLLYTSDAADERSSVDLGGRRIIKK